MNIRGCKGNEKPDDDKQPTVFSPDLIVGCDAAWQNPGVHYINDVCDDSEGFEICTSYQQIIDLGLDDASCSQQADYGTFYITAINTDSKIYGCGSIDTANNTLPVHSVSKMSPFHYVLDKTLISSTSGSWRFEADEYQRLIDGLYKINEEQGGVLCCRTMLNDGLPLSTLTLLVLAAMILVVFIYKLWLSCLERISIACFRSWFVCPGWDGIVRCCCGRIKIPFTRNGYLKLRRESQIKHLRRGCKAYSDLLDEEEISEASGHCVICLDEYADETPVMRLKCGHHYHTDCFLKWLDEKDQCPICGQDLEHATDRHLQTADDDQEDDRLAQISDDVPSRYQDCLQEGP